MRESNFVYKNRIASGLSQAELGEKLGHTSGQFISNIERGLAELPSEHIRHFCRITNASPIAYLRVKLEAERKRLRKIIYGA